MQRGDGGPADGLEGDPGGGRAARLPPRTPPPPRAPRRGSRTFFFRSVLDESGRLPALGPDGGPAAPAPPPPAVEVETGPDPEVLVDDADLEGGEDDEVLDEAIDAFAVRPRALSPVDPETHDGNATIRHPTRLVGTPLWGEVSDAVVHGDGAGGLRGGPDAADLAPDDLADVGGADLAPDDPGSDDGGLAPLDDEAEARDPLEESGWDVVPATVARGPRPGPDVGSLGGCDAPDDDPPGDEEDPDATAGWSAQDDVVADEGDVVGVEASRPEAPLARAAPDPRSDDETRGWSAADHRGDDAGAGQAAPSEAPVGPPGLRPILAPPDVEWALDEAPASGLAGNGAAADGVDPGGGYVGEDPAALEHVAELERAFGDLSEQLGLAQIELDAKAAACRQLEAQVASEARAAAQALAERDEAVRRAEATRRALEDVRHVAARELQALADEQRARREALEDELAGLRGAAGEAEAARAEAAAAATGRARLEDVVRALTDGLDPGALPRELPRDPGRVVAALARAFARLRRYEAEHRRALLLPVPDLEGALARLEAARAAAAGPAAAALDALAARARAARARIDALAAALEAREGGLPELLALRAAVEEAAAVVAAAPPA